MENVLITGGTGFLGRHFIRRARSHLQLTAIGRSAAALQRLATLEVQPVAGSLNDIASWQHELAGQGAVVHCAAPVEYWGRWQKFERDIVQATRTLIDASNRHGVKRFVYISSESVHQDGRPLLDIDESQPYAERPLSHYSRAKQLAEQAVLEYRHVMHVTILRPAFLWGREAPGIATIEGKVRSGGFVWIDRGRAPFEAVHVENAVEAIRLALAPESPGGIFLVTDDTPASVRDFFVPIFERRGLRVPRLSLSSKLLEPLARGLDYGWRTLGLDAKPPLTPFEVAFLAMQRRYDVARIRRVLGYQPAITRAQGVAEL